jgi:hypothetical protein
LPGGRGWYGRFINAGYAGRWWSTTEFDTNNAWYHGMYLDLSVVDRDWADKAGQYSVRCLQDVRP